MKKRIFYYVALCLIAYCDMAFPAETHCKDETQIIFNCRIANMSKIVSVCAIPLPGQDKQYLQYIFGKLGKPELVFPNKNQIKEKQFSYDRQYSSNAGYVRYDLTFTIDKNSYNVYWEELSKTDGVPKEKADVYNGILVKTNSGKSIDLSCDKYKAETNWDPVYDGYNVKRADEQ